MPDETQLTVPSDDTDLSVLPESLSNYLTEIGLPTENVLVPYEERTAVRTNMPGIVKRLGPRAADAVYVSKFVVACAVGLFDAALNYLWNETVANLRSKVERFDLEYFYDTAISSNERHKFQDGADLAKLEDWMLITGCRETGIISDLGYRHLDHIRTMRNWASAAHPNQNELTGLQLAAWLDTCIREVINRDPEASVIEVRRLLRNIREQVLDKPAVTAITAAIDDLPSERIATLFNSLFGMYIDVRLGSGVRSNIIQIAPSAWSVVGDEDRYEIGLKYETLQANGDIERAQLARSLLEAVDGLGYLSDNTLATEMMPAIDALFLAHTGMNNFYNEGPAAERLRKLVPATGRVPSSVRGRYVRVVAQARIGNRYGVAWAATEAYDTIISTWGDDEARLFLKLPAKSEISVRLQYEPCAKRFQEIAEELLKQVTRSVNREGLTFIVNAKVGQLARLETSPAYRAIVARL